MSSRLKTNSCHSASVQFLTVEMGTKLQKVAGQDLKNKLESGEIQRIDGKFIGDSLNVKRPSKLRAQQTKKQNIA